MSSVQLLPAPDPARFEREIAGLVSRTPRGHHDVVFIGSSTFTMWFSLDADLGGIGAVNHGFGGSQLSDCLHFADRLVFPYTPRAVVLYGGDNDMANGKSAETVIGHYEEFARQTFTALPESRLYWVSIKPSIARWTQHAAHTRVNKHVMAAARRDARRSFLDIRPVMFGADGRPDPRLFLEDGLHLSARGYAAWASVLGPQLRGDLLARSP